MQTVHPALHLVRGPCLRRRRGEEPMASLQRQQGGRSLVAKHRWQVSGNCRVVQASGADNGVCGAPMRFYTITGTLGPRTIRRGATSAREALAIVEDLRKTGWTVSLINRGTSAITEHELRKDAGLIPGS